MKKLHQGKHKQSKGAEICTIIRWELECKKCSKTFCEIFGRKNIQNQNNKKRFSNRENMFNPHMHKMGHRRPKHYIFGYHFCSKNARRLRFYVFLHFNARKHIMLSLYLIWTEFTRNCEFVPTWFGSPGTHNWNKVHNFLWIWYTSGWCHVP